MVLMIFRNISYEVHKIFVKHFYKRANIFVNHSEMYMIYDILIA